MILFIGIERNHSLVPERFHARYNETDQEVATENDAEDEGEDRDEEEDKTDEETHTLTVSLIDATVAGPMDGIVTVNDETKETEGPEAQFELEDGIYTIIGSMEDERWGGKDIVGIDGANEEVTVSVYPFFDIHVSTHDLIQTEHNGCETLIGWMTIENHHDRETWPVTAQFTVYTADGEEVTQAGSEFFDIFSAQVEVDELRSRCSECDWNVERCLRLLLGIAHAEVSPATSQTPTYYLPSSRPRGEVGSKLNRKRTRAAH